MAFIYAMTDTWNNNATDFDGIRMDVTNTTSGASSNLINLLLNSTTVLRLKKNGQLILNVGTASAFTSTPCAIGAFGDGFSLGIWQNLRFTAIFRYDRGVKLGNPQPLGWSSNDDPSVADMDIALLRNAQNVLELNTGASASYAHLVLFTNRTVGVTFASLPGVASVSVGGRAMITDGAGAVFNVTAAGGGANVVPVFSDGTQWRVG